MNDLALTTRSNAKPVAIDKIVCAAVEAASIVIDGACDMTKAEGAWAAVWGEGGEAIRYAATARRHAHC